MARAWIGTSGFTYRHWREVFYPKGLPQAEWFDYYAHHFNSVELNVTFYAVPRPATFESWARGAPRISSWPSREAVSSPTYAACLKHRKPSKPSLGG
jgi:hypothetical protein